MQVKCCFVFLFGSLVALSWPQNHVKMHVFPSCKQKIIVKMNVKCIFWGPRAPKSSQLGLLRAGVEATFKLLCKTRKHFKKPWFLALVGSLGAWLPPPQKKNEGLCSQVVFSTRTTKLPATVALLSSFLVKNIATYLVAKLLRNKSAILWNTQNHVNCEVKANVGKNQLEVKSIPFALSISFHSQVTLCMSYIKKVAFLLKAIKQCKT